MATYDDSKDGQEKKKTPINLKGGHEKLLRGLATYQGEEDAE
jgi:hypothetical protein